MLRQLVRRLRRKIEPDPTQPIYIETVPGRGYGLIDPELLRYMQIMGHVTNVNYKFPLTTIILTGMSV